MATDNGLETARITITRVLTTDDGDNGDQVWVETSDGMSLVETLGLLRFAEDSVIRDAMDFEGDEP